MSLESSQVQVTLQIKDYLCISKNFIIVSYDKQGNEINTKAIVLKDNNKFLKDWMNYDSSKDFRSGVYMLGDFYIGQSRDIRTRLLNHIKPIAIGKISNSNIRLSEKLSTFIQSGKVIPVTILSNNYKDENHYIKLFREKELPLLNVFPVHRKLGGI